jgi:hypothetical protein
VVRSRETKLWESKGGLKREVRCDLFAEHEGTRYQFLEFEEFHPGGEGVGSMHINDLMI